VGASRLRVNKSVIITVSFPTYTVKVLIGIYRCKVSEHYVDCRVLDEFKGLLLKVCNSGMTERLLHRLRYKFTIQYRATHPRKSINKSILLFQPNAQNKVKTYIQINLQTRCINLSDLLPVV